jgi:hypothetical protein
MTAMQALKGGRTRDLFEDREWEGSVWIIQQVYRFLELAWLAECRKTTD